MTDCTRDKHVCEHSNKAEYGDLRGTCISYAVMINPSTDISLPERRKCEKTKNSNTEANLGSM